MWRSILSVIGSDQARFQFAKAAILLRKSGIGRGAEEAVVLAFGGSTSTGSAVHVTRKVKKRPLVRLCACMAKIIVDAHATVEGIQVGKPVLRIRTSDYISSLFVHLSKLFVFNLAGVAE